MAALDSPSIKYNVLIQALRMPWMKTLYVADGGRIYTHKVKGAAPVVTSDIIAQKKDISDAYMNAIKDKTVKKPDPK